MRLCTAQAIADRYLATDQSSYDWHSTGLIGSVVQTLLKSRAVGNNILATRLSNALALHIRKCDDRLHHPENYREGQ